MCPWGGESDSDGGVTCDYIQQSSTISFSALRQLRFRADGHDESKTSPKARAVLAAIALHAVALNVERGWHLRSRCDLVLDEGESVDWDLLGGGSSSEKSTISTADTRDLLNMQPSTRQ